MNIYQINTAVFLRERGVDFASVPDEEWDKIAQLPIDTVWFMGVWQRSPRSKALNDGAEWLKHDLPDVQPDDIIGSAYSIRDYVVDERFGGDAGLAVAREKLQARGIKLMLDFVPNHIAIDHPWVTEHPEYLLGGSPEELAEHPDAFIQTDTGIWANGRDPTFPPWSDVLQLNAFSAPLRQAAIETLQRLMTMCDAVRCDMAMLMLNDVFAKTWGSRAGEAPTTEYWQDIIGAVKAMRPDFVFLAEVYWEKEVTLLGQGFDFCYDKTTYDALVKGSAHDLRTHLKHTQEYQRQLLHFIENHDEPRAAQEFTLEKHKAAAVIALTLPGARLIHDGEREGRLKRVPVQLNRRQDEPVNPDIAAFYNELFEQIKSSGIGKGEWYPTPLKSRLFHQSVHHVFSWSWQYEGKTTTVLVNYSGRSAHLRLNDGAKVVLGPWEYRISSK